MKYCENILETIGNTPLVKLSKVTKGLKPTVLAKVECFNPGGSVKDRPAVKMIEEAEKAGLLKPGGTLIEPTSGNTGTGLAQIAAVKGYRCILVCPDKVAPEKINLLKAYGAEVVIVPSTVSAGSPESYYSVANRLEREIPGGFQPNQFANPNNPSAHYDSTGPEIWEATEGKITCLVAGVGTGGTISGIARYLKEKNPNIKIVGADPEGSIYSGDTPGSYKVEGIGEDFIPKSADLKIVDTFERVSDKESFLMTRRLAREEGILVGGSCGTATVAAIRQAEKMGPDDVIVIIMADGGRGYISKIFNDQWMSDFGFLPTPGMSFYAKDLLAHKVNHDKVPVMITIKPDDTVKDAIDLMNKYQIDQLPVVTESGSNVGHINDLVAMQIVYERKKPETMRVDSVMGRPFPQLDESVEIDALYRQFKLGTNMVIMTRDGKACGVLTKFDIVAHLQAEAAGADGAAAHLSKDGKEKAAKMPV